MDFANIAKLMNTLIEYFAMLKPVLNTIPRMDRDKFDIAKFANENLFFHSIILYCRVINFRLMRSLVDKLYSCDKT